MHMHVAIQIVYCNYMLHLMWNVTMLTPLLQARISCNLFLQDVQISYSIAKAIISIGVQIYFSIANEIYFYSEYKFVIP